MRISELIKGLDAWADERISDIDITDIVTHTDRVTKGSMFVCISGERYSAESFVTVASDNGAVAFLVDKNFKNIEELPCVVVESIKDILPKMLSKLYNYPQKQVFSIGITGTKGKTTTAEFLSKILSATGCKNILISTVGVSFPDGRCLCSSNTTPSVDLVYGYLRDAVRSNIKYAVIEVSSQALASGRVLGIEFPIAVFTGFSEDHIGDGEHRTTEEYFAAKRSLFENYGVGCAVVNHDDPSYKAMTKGVGKIITVGNSPSCAYVIEGVRSELCGTHFSLNRHSFSLSMAGGFNSMNAALAIATAAEITGKEPSAFSAPLRLAHPSGRFEIYTLKGRVFVIDYAHNKESFRAVLSYAREKCSGRLIAVFGSVGGRCIGRRSDLAEIAERYADISIVTSDNSAQECASDICEEIRLSFIDKDRVVAIPDRADAIRYSYEISLSGDMILLLGKGHERYQLVGRERVYFSEKEILFSMGAVPYSINES